LFYCPKASRKERDAGCDRLPVRTLDLFPQSHRDGKPPTQARNPHPTVKPLSLMRWLIGLVTPPDGSVLDPFCGSGTTGIAALLEGRRFLGIEAQDDYVQVARARIAHRAPDPGFDSGPAAAQAQAQAAGPFVPAAKAARR
ncbi:site-specific DNA-methyltransferase, partial [Patulibacter sp. NPDC049589]|uniref:site-specific DNA-methyltransferase n=1 Tax=Patulibacter sp. NPDC049589 TaxID=3154731 RepID=UPI00341E28FE